MALRHATALLTFFAVLAGIACSSDAGLQPFTSDGCSLFPDRDVITRDDWCVCCLEHDLAYWRGGTEAEREAADRRLEACIVDRTGNEALARVMYQGVRFGGSPYFYNWYRWGYGWPYERKYQALTPEESALAHRLEQAYFESTADRPCASKP